MLSSLTVSLTPSSAGDNYDYERLETIGDTALKFLATLCAFDCLPGTLPGDLVYFKDRIVSNITLANGTVAVGLDMLIPTTNISHENWKPPTYTSPLPQRQGDVQGRSNCMD